MKVIMQSMIHIKLPININTTVPILKYEQIYLTNICFDKSLKRVEILENVYGNYRWNSQNLPMFLGIMKKLSKYFLIIFKHNYDLQAYI